jgi:hypothetical protein
MLLARWMYFLMLTLLPRNTLHEAMEPKKKEFEYEELP